MSSYCLQLISLDPFAPVVAKLSDFGSSSRVVLESHKESARSRAVGNPTWLAPEVTRVRCCESSLPFLTVDMKGEPYSVASDVYSFSLLMWEIYSKHVPLDRFCENMLTTSFAENSHLQSLNGSATSNSKRRCKRALALLLRPPLLQITST